MMSGLLLGMVLSIRTGWLQYMVTLLQDLFRLIWYMVIPVYGHTGIRCLLLLLLLLFATDEAEIFFAKMAM